MLPRALLTLIIYWAVIVASGAHRMSKRRISQKALADIGAERTGRLLALAEEAVRQGRYDRARRYTDLAKRISAKTQAPMPRGHAICKGCGIPLLPGIDCRVRLGSHAVRVTCGLCGEVRRRPYLKEQSHD